MKRISGSPSAVTRALLPGAKAVSFSVTHDEFDRVDNGWGPGDYAWLDVDDSVAAAWEAGLAACTEAGTDHLSRAGMVLRWQAVHGDMPMSAELLAWIADREARLAAEAEARRAREADIARYDAALEGYENLGRHRLLSQHGALCSRSIPADSEILYAGPARTDGNLQLVRVDEHNIIENIRGGMSANWWSNDPALIADAAKRKEITGYFYARPLARALVELERSVPVGWAGGWVDGYGASQLAKHAWQGADSGANNPTAAEKLARLRKHLVARAEKDATHAALITEALALSVEGSLTETHFSALEIVGAQEIAEKLSVKRATVDMWRQRDTGFPAPSRTIGGRPAWTWLPIAAWARDTARTTT